MSQRETKQNRTRLGAALMGALMLVGAIEVIAPASVSATSSFSFTRIAGDNRYATAAASAAGAFPSGADNAIVANGAKDHFPDALAASYLAGSLAGPILLTDVNSLPSATDSALTSLKTKNVTIVGGTAAVGSAVEKALKDDGYTVTRVAGANRYDTAAAIAAKPTSSYVGSDPSGKKTAVIASGVNFPDALVSGPLGYQSKFPVEITEPSKLSSQTKQSLQSLGIQNVLIAGGTSAVSTAAENEIKALGITTTRFAGTDRTDTAAKIATYETDTLSYSKTTIDLARGDDPADSLGSAPYGGVKKTPLLLTIDANTLGSPTKTYLGVHSNQLTSGAIFGGTSAVSTAVQNEATSAAKGENQVTVAASPSSVKANGTDTSTVTITVKKADGTAIANDSLTISRTGTPAGACGTTPNSATTNSSGTATVTYTASSTTGSCEISVTEAQGNAVGKTTITQTTASGNTVTVKRATADTLAANGSQQETLTVKVTNTSGAAVAADQLHYTVTPATCGAAPGDAVTNNNGEHTATYTASTTPGTCTITATESGTGSSGSTTVTQSYVGARAAPTVLDPNGTSTSTITVTVFKAGTVKDATVTFTKTGTCGTIPDPAAKTNTEGVVTATYTSSTSLGTCTLTATATKDSATIGTGTTEVTQAGETFDVAASATQIPRSIGQSTITAKIKPASGTATASQNGRTVTFAIVSGTGANVCGPLPADASPETAQNPVTMEHGVASVAYTAGANPGKCTISATTTLNPGTPNELEVTKQVVIENL